MTFLVGVVVIGVVVGATIVHVTWWLAKREEEREHHGRY